LFSRQRVACWEALSETEVGCADAAAQPDASAWPADDENATTLRAARAVSLGRSCIQYLFGYPIVDLRKRSDDRRHGA
jgi:hypothetical protein